MSGAGACRGRLKGWLASIVGCDPCLMTFERRTATGTRKPTRFRAPRVRRRALWDGIAKRRRTKDGRKLDRGVIFYMSLTVSCPHTPARSGNRAKIPEYIEFGPPRICTTYNNNSPHMRKPSNCRDPSVFGASLVTVTPCTCSSGRGGLGQSFRKITRAGLTPTPGLVPPRNKPPYAGPEAD